jgi:hypothetical protein
MSTATITKEVTGMGTTRKVTFIVNEHGCVVTPDGSDLTTVISWENITDVETLADLFCNERVYLFKAIVETLGKIYAARNLYTDI